VKSVFTDLNNTTKKGGEGGAPLRAKNEGLGPFEEVVGSAGGRKNIMGRRGERGEEAGVRITPKGGEGQQMAGGLRLARTKVRYRKREGSTRRWAKMSPGGKRGTETAPGGRLLKVGILQKGEKGLDGIEGDSMMGGWEK